MDNELTSELSSKGYWPAVAYEYFRQEKYDRALELCRRRLSENPGLLSGRVILARALYESGDTASAEDEFYGILKSDPENLVALKYLADIKFKNGDEATALSLYERIQKIDPHSPGLWCSLRKESGGRVTRSVTLKRGAEETSGKNGQTRDLPFRTETMGDLLLSQGHTRLALQVYEELAESEINDRLAEKMERARSQLNKKEK